MADHLTPEALAELERLERAATPGEWRVYFEPTDTNPGIEAADGTAIVFFGDENDTDECGVRGRTPAEAEANAKLASLLRTNASALIAAARERDALRADVEALRTLWLPCDQTVACAICLWVDWNDGEHPETCPLGYMEARHREAVANAEAERDAASAERDDLRSALDAGSKEVSDALDLRAEVRQQNLTMSSLEARRFALEQEVERLRAALEVSLAAMQANIAYATRKDEQALARGIEAARAALATKEPK